MALTHSEAGSKMRACLVVCRQRQGSSFVPNGNPNHFSALHSASPETRAHTPRARARTPPQRAQRTSSCSTASGLPRQQPSRRSAWARVKVWGGGFARRQYNMCEGKVGSLRHCWVCVCKLKVSNQGVFAKSNQAHRNRKSKIERDTRPHFLVTSSPALQPPPILTLM